MVNKLKNKIIPIFVPHQGCPHDCVFCNQKKITGISTDMTAERTRSIIEESLKTIQNDTNIEIAFFGGSFTAIDSNIQKELLSVAYEYKKSGLVNDIRMSTRPDCIDSASLELIKSLGTTIIELGVQSMDNEVLVDSLRGHSSEIVRQSSELIKDFGIKLGLQMMVGLPSDTEEKCIQTAFDFVDMKPDFVRIYPTIVIKETGLENAYLDGRYEPFDIDKCIDIVKKLLVIFERNKIKVIRVGLQSTDDIQVGRDIVAGPYHPAFKELVASRMVQDYLVSLIKDNVEDNEKHDFDEIVVIAPKRLVSTIIGNKKSNVRFFYEKFGCRLKTIESEKNCVNEGDDILTVMIDDKIICKTTISEINDSLFDVYGLGR